MSVPIRPSRSCAGRGIDRLEMKFGGKTYAAQKSVQLLMKAGIAESEKYCNQSYMSRAVGVLLTQMSATEGIKKHGEKAIAVLVKEFKQLDTGPMEGKKVVEPVTYNSLTPKEKKEALEAINLIKEKRDGSLKGRSCANGAKQRRFLKSDEVFHPLQCRMKLSLVLLSLTLWSVEMWAQRMCQELIFMPSCPKIKGSF